MMCLKNCSFSQGMTIKISTRKMLLMLVILTCNFLCSVDTSQMGCNYFLSPTDLTADSVLGKIQLPFVRTQNYLPHQHCEWNIRTENPYNVIHLFIDKCEIEGPDLDDECNRDYLDFYEVKKSGKQIHMGRFCGQVAKGKLLETSSSHMMIHFVSNGNFEFSGFELTYLSQPKKEKSKDDSSNALAVGIPVGIISLAIALIIIAYFYRRWFLRKTSIPCLSPATSSSSATPGPCQRNRAPTEQSQEIRQHPQLIVSSRSATESDQWATSSRQRNYLPNRGTSPYSHNCNHSQEQNNEEGSYLQTFDFTPQGNLPEYSSDDGASIQVVNSESQASNLISDSQHRGRLSPLSSSVAFSAATSSTPAPVAAVISDGSGDGGGNVRHSYGGTVVSNAEFGVDNGTRCRTPPPSYESTILQDGLMMQRQGGHPMITSQAPPDYDFVMRLKDQGQSDMDSSL